MGVFDRTMARFDADVERAERAERADLAQAAVEAAASDEARARTAEILMAAGRRPGLSDKDRGREVARLYAELKALFDA